jgi:hypothetical protein
MKDELEDVGVESRLDSPKKVAGGDIASCGDPRVAQGDAGGSNDVRLIGQEAAAAIVGAQDGGE